MRPPIELMKTMRPPARRIEGSIAWVTATWAVRLISIWRRKSSIGIVSSGLGIATPALLTSPSRPPSSASIQRRRRGDLLGVGDVEEERRDALGAGLAQRLRVRLLADPGENPPAGGVQAQRRGTADAGRSAGDQY